MDRKAWKNHFTQDVNGTFICCNSRHKVQEEKEKGLSKSHCTKMTNDNAVQSLLTLTAYSLTNTWTYLQQIAIASNIIRLTMQNKTIFWVKSEHRLFMDIQKV